MEQTVATEVLTVPTEYRPFSNSPRPANLFHKGSPVTTPSPPPLVAYPAQGSPAMAPTDRAALLALFRSTGGATWWGKHNWGTDAELSRWYGVTVNDQGRVVKICLNFNNLRGMKSHRYLSYHHVNGNRRNLTGLSCIVHCEGILKVVRQHHCPVVFQTGQSLPPQCTSS